MPIRIWRASLILCLQVCATLSCSPRDPQWYPVPPQTPFIPIDHPKLQYVDMNNPDVKDYIVRDVDDFLAGDLWRWTYDQPTLRFWLTQTEHLSLDFDFASVAGTLKETGPQTVSFFVNDHLAGKMTIASPGRYHFKKGVPSEWLDTKKATEVSALITPVFIAKGAAKHYGIVLVGAGFRAH